jgi:AraC-like DNA-binding protein
MEALFLFDRHNYLDCQNAFRGPRNQEYYLGDYSIETGPVIDVRAYRKAVGASSMIILRSTTSLFFRRSWSHIREDSTDVAVLWFVNHGNLHVSHQHGYCVAKSGYFLITKSMTPFSIECQTDENRVHEAFHIIVPTHILRRFFRQDVCVGFCVAADSREFTIAKRIFMDIFEHADELSDRVSQKLMDTALKILCNAIKGFGGCSPMRRSLSDQRLREVLKFIETHLSNPNLSIDSAAKGCGISTRYLSFLLQGQGTSFSNLIWDKRLAAARQWLSSTTSSEVSIGEIAYKVGFKRPSHFSRMFRQVFNMTPRQFRTSGLLELENQHGSVNAAYGKTPLCQMEILRNIDMKNSLEATFLAA